MPKFVIGEFRNHGGSTSYRVYGRVPGPSGRVVRENFRTLPEALTRKAELEIQAANTAADLLVMRPTRLSMAELGDAEMALRRLNGKGSLVDAAEYYLKHARPDLPDTLLSVAFERFLVEKKSQNLRPRTLDNLRVRVERLVKLHGHKPLAAVSVEDVRRLIQRDKSPLTQNGDRGALHGFFEWAVRREFLDANPVARLSPARTERSEPVALSLEEITGLLKAALDHKEGVLVPYLSLSLFCGLRPAELERLGWKDIDLDHRVLTIRGSAAKLRARRVVELTDNVVEWLKPHAGKTAIVGRNWRRELDAVRRAGGFKGSVWKKKCDARLRAWPSDALRHTSVSMWMAHFRDEGKCADRHGNSVDVIHRHYRALVRPGAAAIFWALRPDNLDAGPAPMAAVA